MWGLVSQLHAVHVHSHEEAGHSVESDHEHNDLNEGEVKEENHDHNE
jgi:hypothetical protein